ncbi:hypothetical protein [Peredibacter starrii]|uniref:DUF304 domain-containing protein n=1 Tax=Peredibacter starrii TaxID=28202 RepID=A0AAX4HRV5_9BACT|nr:hypothetical protein [Peredibacter starrii]WPU65987.1 hypothetical protein SOO65_04445 [Peredibacter starrii]
MNFEIDLVDKSIHRNQMKAIFYELALLHDRGKPFKSVFTLCLFLAFTIFVFVEKPKLYLLAGSIGIIILAFPFCASAIIYYSKMYVSNGKFEVRCGPFKYHSGPLSNLIEIHHLRQSFNGIYRVRVLGFGETSGFTLHYNEVPKALQFLKVIEKDV